MSSSLLSVLWWEVDPAKAAATRIAGRETYFFCSQNCLDAFDKNPVWRYAP